MLRPFLLLLLLCLSISPSLSLPFISYSPASASGSSFIANVDNGIYLPYPFMPGGQGNGQGVSLYLSINL
jgi:hypothetical protein